MRLRAEDLDWLLSAAGVRPGTRVYQVLQARYVDGYRDVAIAAALGISPSTVRGYAYEGWQAIHALLQTGRVGEYGVEVADRLELADVSCEEPESLWEHAEGVRDAILNGRRCRAVTLDLVIQAIFAVRRQKSS